MVKINNDSSVFGSSENEEYDNAFKESKLKINSKPLKNNIPQKLSIKNKF